MYLPCFTKFSLISCLNYNLKKYLFPFPNTTACKIKLGFDEAAQRRFSNYLYGRMQKIKISDCLHSDRKEVKSGVPQGNIMGLILF